MLCFRVDTPGGSTEPLKGYMEDEHATAHAEEAFFQQVIISSYTVYGNEHSYSAFITVVSCNTHVNPMGGLISISWQAFALVIMLYDNVFFSFMPPLIPTLSFPGAP